MANVTVNLQLSNDSLASSSTLLAEGVLSSKSINIVITPMVSQYLTAFVTGVTFSESRDGAPIFKVGAVGSVFAATNPGSVTLKMNNSATVAYATVPVSATGNACALGAQVLSYAVTLSSRALSGNGTNVVAADVDIATQTLTTKITAVNTPFGRSTCRAEFARLRNLEVF